MELQLEVRKARQKQIRYTSRIRNEQLFSLFFPTCCTNLCIRDEHEYIRSRPCKANIFVFSALIVLIVLSAILLAMTCHDKVLPLITTEEPWRGICGARRSRLNWMASTSSTCLGRQKTETERAFSVNIPTDHVPHFSLWLLHYSY